MAQEFWRARLPMQLKPLQQMAQGFDPALRDAIEQGVSELATIELIRDEASNRRMALMVSVQRKRDPDRAHGQDGDLTCWMAFCNDQDWCDKFRTHGVPVIESRIDFEGGKVSVHSPAYPVRAMGQPISLCEQHILTLEGVALGADDESPLSDSWTPGYRQCKSAPDIAQQTTDLSVTHFAWAPLRRGLRPLDGVGVRLEVGAAAWPSLADVLCPDGGHAVVHGFEQLQAGRFLDTESVYAQAPNVSELPNSPFSCWPGPSAQPAPPPKVTRLPAASVFGAPHFVFEDVDVVGFRLTLPDSAMPRLQKLIDPLNFHRSADGAMDDFNWRVATPTVVIELLHYGQMRTRSPLAPLMPHDYMSQHELLVRLLVGKVDDDGSQARDASLYVPTIFVDNPWSKYVGRESQGFTKELAEFCVRDEEQGGLCALDMFGRRKGRSHPLTQVVQVRTPPGFRDSHMHPLLDLRYPTRMGDDSRFEPVDLNVVLANPFGFSRWRQSDFGGREFRKSFARQAMSSGFNGFRTVQATPVDKRGLPSAWIQGRMQITKMSALFPPGIATLVLSAHGRPHDAADPWRALCEILGDQEINLPAGDWYRLKMNLDLGVDNSLDW